MSPLSWDPSILNLLDLFKCYDREGSGLKLGRSCPLTAHSTFFVTISPYSHGFLLQLLWHFMGYVHC